MEKAINLLARLLLAQIFVISAVNKLINWNGTEKYMASKGLPLIPLLLFLAVTFEILGAISLIFDYKTQIGAALLIVFLIVVTPIFHNFWALPAPQKKLQMIMFIKNLAIIGGLMPFLVPKNKMDNSLQK